MIRRLSISLLIVIISSWAGKLLAGDYHVEIIVFKNMTEHTAHDSRHYTPPADIPSFAAHWEADEYKLKEQLKQIQESENYQILLHHAWQQESLPYSESAAVEFVLDPKIHNQFSRPLSKKRAQKQNINPRPITNKTLQPTTDKENTEKIDNQAVVNQALNGWIKIFAKTLLFAQFDLDYFGYRLQEKRRLLLDEVHFLDHPKFGVLLQISRIEEIEEETTDALNVGTVNTGAEAEEKTN